METREKATELVLALWRAIDWDNIGASRRMGIYDEFEGKLRASASTDTIYSFLERIKKKMGLQNLKETELVEMIKDDGGDILDHIRKETSFLVLKMRKIQEDKKNNYYNEVRETMRDRNYTEEEIEERIAELKGETYEKVEDEEVIQKLFGGDNDEN